MRIFFGVLKAIVFSRSYTVCGGSLSNILNKE